MLEKRLKISFLIFAFIFLQSCTKVVNSTSAEDGVIDLQNVAFNDKTVYSLKGDWEFYWKQEYFFEDFMDNSPEKNFAVVPSDWVNLPSTKGEHKGFATYRLKILLPKNIQYPTIWFRQLTSAANIYVNGQSAYSIGKFSTDEENSVQESHSDFFEFEYPQDGVVDLIVHVSNYEQYWFSGIIENLYIGNRKAIETRVIQLSSSEMFLIGTFVVIAFYYFMLFFYRRTDYFVLISALLSFDIAMRIFSTGEKMGARIFSGIPSEIYVRMEYISWFLVMPFFLHFLFFNFKLFKYKKHILINYVISILFSLFALFVPVFILTGTMHLFQGIFIAQMFFFFFLLWTAYKDNKWGAKFLMVISGVLIIAALHDIGKANGMLYQQEIYLAPFSLVFFLYSQMSSFAYRFYDSFTKSKTLNTRLQAENMKLLHNHALKDSFLFNTSLQLKSPLNFITALIDTTAKKEPAFDVERNVKTISLLSMQLVNQIHNILDVSKFVGKDLSTLIVTIDFKKIVAICLAIWDSIAKERKIFLHNLIEERYYVYADEQHLQQVFYTIIRIAFYYGSKKDIEISATKQDDFLKVTVQSSFSQEMIPVLERSMAVGYEEDVKGCYFQLVLAKKLMQLQNGELELFKGREDTPVGFSITLPLSKEKEVEENSVEYVKDSPLELVKEFEESVRFQKELLQDSWFLQIQDTKLHALIVSSNNADATHMQTYLHSLKISSVLTNTGEQGLKALDLDSSFDVVIIESSLTDMSGYELSKKIREQYQLTSFPILMVSLSNRIQEIFDVFENGANDYITKPFDKNEFLVRINLLISYKSAMAEREKIKSMEKELGMAKKIQDSLLPKEIPEIKSIQFATLYFPMSMVGGDFYDIKQISETSFSVLVADVSGHGIPAALIASMLKISLQHNKELLALPGDLLSAVNNDLSSNLESNFLTAIYAYFDLDKKNVTISRAGHPPVLVKSQDIDEVKEVKPQGPIIGFSADSIYKEETVELTAGDRFVFYSDGITELNPVGSAGLDEREEYGDKRFSEFIQLSAPVETNAFISLLVENIFDYSGLDTFDDDLTMVVVDYRP